MPELENNDNEVIDPIILAAMVEDPDEDEEDKKKREEYGLVAEAGDGSDDDDSDDDDSDSSDDDDSEDEDEDSDDDKKNKKVEKKPTEAEDDDSDDDDDDSEEDEDEEEDKPKTRKQKRKERQEDFLESIRKDNVKGGRQTQIPTYNPLDYEKPPVDAEGNPREYTAEELAKDRNLVGAVNFAKGAEEARFWAEQDQFWSELGTESKILAHDPELNFLNEELPDGKKNPNFKPEKAEEVNQMYLQFVGFKQHQRKNAQGQALFNQDGTPQLFSTVDRTDISYEKFARRHVKSMKAWAEEEVDDAVDDAKDKVIKQRKKAGIRPGAGKRKSLGAINHGDITRMSDEEFEKNEAAIDAQINNMLNM